MAQSALNRAAKSAFPFAESEKKKGDSNARFAKPDAASDAVEKSSKSGTVRATKEEPQMRKVARA